MSGTITRAGACNNVQQRLRASGRGRATAAPCGRNLNGTVGRTISALIGGPTSKLAMPVRWAAYRQGHIRTLGYRFGEPDDSTPHARQVSHTGESEP